MELSYNMKLSRLLMVIIPPSHLYIVFSVSNNGSQLTCDQHNLPYLDSVNAIENLDGNQLVGYITGYGVVPPAAADPAATNHLQKQTLKRLVGVSLMS